MRWYAVSRGIAYDDRRDCFTESDCSTDAAKYIEVIFFFWEHGSGGDASLDSESTSRDGFILGLLCSRYNELKTNYNELKTLNGEMLKFLETLQEQLQDERKHKDSRPFSTLR